MWVKLIGALLAVGGGTLIGYALAGLDKRRACDLAELKKALAYLKSDISYSLTPMPEALQNISVKVKGTAAAVLARAAELLHSNGETIHSAWSGALDYALNEGRLHREDADALRGLAHSLGYQDKGLQLSSIDMLSDYIDLKTRELVAKTEKNSRLYVSLGVMGGLLVTIMLI